MDARYEKLLKCRDYVRTRTDFVPKAALTLGSGLGGFASEVDIVCEVPYADIPGFPVSTVPGHAGKFHLRLPARACPSSACRAACTTTRATSSAMWCCPRA